MAKGSLHKWSRTPLPEKEHRETTLIAGKSCDAGNASLNLQHPKTLLRLRLRPRVDIPLSTHSLRLSFCIAPTKTDQPTATIKKRARHASMIYIEMSNEHLEREMDIVF